MTELVHHTNESTDGGVSPFDTAVKDIVADEDVLIACPYVTLEYLESLLERAASWRVLTDVEAWLGNYSTNEREAIREFIARHHDQVHDVRNLHAKAVVGETGALVGSANLTWTGMQARDELAIRLDDPERIRELREWFDGVWAEGSPANLDDVDEHIRTSAPVSSSAERSSATSIPSDSRRVSASVDETRSEKDHHQELRRPEASGHDQLVERIKRAPSRAWTAKHFELMSDVIEITGLTEEDTQLVTSVPKSGDEVRIIIGNRVVFSFVGGPGNWTRYIIPSNYQELEKLRQNVPHCYDFKGGKNAPHLPAVTDGLHRARETSFRKASLEAILNEIGRFERSPYRSRSHEPVVYRAAVDHDYRERVLSEAFGGE